MSNDDWNIDGNLNWGFFFFDKKKKNLERLLDRLVSEGFQLNRLSETEFGDWRLHISKRETITPQELHNRNLKFNELAKSYSVELYDGWDVEK